MNDLLLNGLKSKMKTSEQIYLVSLWRCCFLTMKMFRAAVRSLFSAFITKFEHEFCCCEVVSMF